MFSVTSEQIVRKMVEAAKEHDVLSPVITLAALVQAISKTNTRAVYQPRDAEVWNRIPETDSDLLVLYDYLARILKSMQADFGNLPA